MNEFFNSIPLGFYVFGAILNAVISGAIGTILLVKTRTKTNRLFAIFFILYSNFGHFFILYRC